MAVVTGKMIQIPSYVSKAEKDRWNGKADKSMVLSTSLFSDMWDLSSDEYPIMEVHAEGFTATSNQDLIPGINITAEQLKAFEQANIQDGGQADGMIILKAFGKTPTIDIPVRFIIRGDS